MTAQIISDDFANLIANLITATLSSGSIELYAGDPNSGGTMLMSGLLPVAPFGTASAGVLTLAGQWFGTVAVAGTCNFARLADVTGDYWLDVTVGTTGAQLILSDVALEVNDVVKVTAFTYMVPLT